MILLEGEDVGGTGEYSRHCLDTLLYENSSLLNFVRLLSYAHATACNDDKPLN